MLQKNNKIYSHTYLHTYIHTVASRREQAMLPNVKTTDRNHAVLLGMKSFLPRMVKLVSVRNKLPIARWADELMSRLPPTQVHTSVYMCIHTFMHVMMRYGYT